MENRRKIIHRLGEYTVSFPGPYYMKNETLDAKMEVRNGKYIVLEGSRIDPNYYSHEELIKKKRNEYGNCLDDKKVTVIKNIEFDSPSMVAAFVRGGASNGKYYWRTEDDKKLGDFITYTSK